MFSIDPHMPISPSAMSLSRSIFLTSSLSLNKILNHRDRGVRRDKNGQRLKALGARGKRLPFPTLPGRQNSQGAFKKGSLRSLLPLRSSPCLPPRKIQKKKHFDSPKGEKNHKAQRAARTQSGRNIHKFIRVFSLLEENALRSLRFNSFSLPGGYGGSDPFLGNKKSPFLVDKKGLEVSFPPTLSSKVFLPCWS